MSIKKTNLLLVIMSASFVFPFALQAQGTQLSTSDQTQILRAILKRENFRGGETWRDELQQNTVFILAPPNFLRDQIPTVDGVKFVLIGPQEVENRKQSGLEFYRFGEFKCRNGIVRMSFIREFVNLAGKHSNGSITEYTCRKVNGAWHVKGRLGPVYTAESK